MKVIVAKDYKELSSLAADIMEQVIRSKPDARMGLATGSSPVGMYQEMARRCAEEGLDFSKACSVNLDEYVGLAPEHEQSYRRFMNENLFDHINIDKNNTYVALGTGDIDANLKEFQAVLDSKQTDLQVLGIGVDGHVGFNEPGECLFGEAHLEVLDDSTLEANKRFFASKAEVPTKAVTMGLKNIMQAKKLVVVVNGKNKAAATKQLVMTDEVTTKNPVTFVRLHPDCTVIIDQELADAMGYKG